MSFGICNESEVSRIEQLLLQMEKGTLDDENILSEFPELATKSTENDKLRYRLDILKRAATECETSESSKMKKNAAADGSDFDAKKSVLKKAPKYIEVEDYGDSIIEKLNSLFTAAIEATFPGLSLSVNVKETNNRRHGDYQFDDCFQIARILKKEQQIELTPKEIGSRISKNLETIPLVEKFDVVNNFINIFVNKEHLGKKMAEVFSKGVSLPTLSKRRVIVDFSSPNIAKQMHVGHLRSTIIGESISKLLELLGFSVIRINHIGDWGTQFGMLIAYLRERFPNYLKEPPQIEDLQAFYKQSKIKFDEDADFKARAYQCVVKLQSYEPEFVDAWKMICDISRKDFEKIYKCLDVTQLVERGESFYQSRMQTLVQQFEKDGVFEEHEGRKLLFVKGCTIPLTVVKSDGGFTYATSDLATIKQRIFEEKADWILYVVDKGQFEHLEAIFAAARNFGWYHPEEKRVEHVQFGLVLGEDKKKFKTRSGETIKLLDLLDEGKRRAEAKLKARDTNFSPEELKEAAESLAYGCIKYADLSQSRNSDYVFSFEKMLDDRGNTAIYLLYAYTRIRSIARNAKVSRQAIDEYLGGLEGGVVPLDHPREIRLAKQILKFSDCILGVLASLQISKICDYIYELATLFHDFYKECYVVTKAKSEETEGKKEGEGGGGKEEKELVVNINFGRLVLCEVTADVMQRCFSILGIRPIDRM